MMSNKKTLILADKKESLVDLGHQVKALLPGGNKLTDNQAISIGNYAALTKANPFRGEVYGYQGKDGQLILVDGYKLLIRWAKSISDYDEDYGDRLPPGVEGIKEGDIGYRLTIMRHDRKKGIREYVDLGATFQEAYSLMANQAVGIVTAYETRNAPPKGWSWDEVARKRALKNVLNRAYPMPSIEDLARLNWEVNGTETLPEDWVEPGFYKTTEEAERHAELAAQERERIVNVAAMDDDERRAYNQRIREATNIMRNNGDDDPLDLSPEEPEPAAAVEVPPELSAYREAFRAAAATVPPKKVTQQRLDLLYSKVNEVFGGDGIAAMAVLNWLVSEKDKLSYGESQELLKLMLLKQDETGDYPLNPKFCQVAKEIYRQTQVEAGQMSLI